MPDAGSQTKKVMPKGGRKGGTRYPHIALDKAIEYSKKLVAKTHTNPLPSTTIFPGVFGNSGATGTVRASALRQYGLLEGSNAALGASKLAKDIDGAPNDERPALIRQAFMEAYVFGEIFKTFQGDAVSRSKIEQRARGLEVHPDLASECTNIFVDSLITAGLGILNGENIHLNALQQEQLATLHPEEAEPPPTKDEPSAQIEEEATGIVRITKNGDDSRASLTGTVVPEYLLNLPRKPSVAVNIDVDSNTDAVKLEKNLVLLRSFGLI